MNTHFYALYYPTIEFQDHRWLQGAALLWDRIYRIVPSSYQPNDSTYVKTLMDTEEIGIPIAPDPYVRTTAEKFIKKLKSRKWDAAALSYDIPENYTRLHKDKVDAQLKEMIIAQGGIENNDGWLHIPTDFQAHYMTYLANVIADKNNLSVLTDNVPAWTGATYFKYNGEIEDFPREDSRHVLATMVLRDIIPENIGFISPEKIIEFRNKYQDERQRFMSAIQSASSIISNCEDPKIVKDHIEDIKNDITSSLKDYRASLKTINIAGLAGLKSLSFPVTAEVAAVIAGQGLNVQTLITLSSIGLGIGLVSGFHDWSQQKKKLSKESDYSYLMHLSRAWKKCALYKNDYNYYLCRSMEEFIND